MWPFDNIENLGSAFFCSYKISDLNYYYKTSNSAEAGFFWRIFKDYLKEESFWIKHIQIYYAIFDIRLKMWSQITIQKSQRSRAHEIIVMYILPE